MKKYLHYLIIFLGVSAILSELINDFEEIKISYATFNPKKYFEPEEFKVTVFSSASGTIPSHNLTYYQGYLLRNKIKYSITSHDKTINKIRLNNGNIPVWFCNIKGVSKLILRTKETPPDKPFFKIYFYIFCWIGSIYSVICLNIMKKRKQT